MEQQRYEYDAFISYRHTPLDMAVATKLQYLLEKHKSSRNVGHKLKIFRDRTDMPLAASLGDSIQKALEKSRFLIIICSPEYLQSEYCRHELEYFIDFNKSTDKVITVLVKGKPRETFPKILMETNMAFHSSLGNEPLAADLRNLIENDTKGSTSVKKSMRNAKKKLRTEFLRVAAFLYGCSYDDLYQRSKRQKRKRVITIGAVILSIMLVSAVYIIYNTQHIRLQEATIRLQETMIELNEGKIQSEKRQTTIMNIYKEYPKVLRLSEKGYKLQAIENILNLVKQYSNDEEFMELINQEFYPIMLSSNYIPAFTEFSVIEKEYDYVDLTISSKGNYVILTGTGHTEWPIVVYDKYFRFQKYIHIDLPEIDTGEHIKGVEYDEDNSIITFIYSFGKMYSYNTDGDYLGEETYFDNETETNFYLIEDGSKVVAIECINSDQYAFIPKICDELGVCIDSYGRSFKILDDFNIVCLYSNNQSKDAIWSDYDSQSSGGFIIIDFLDEEITNYQIPEPKDLYEYDRIFPIGDENIILIITKQGVYRTNVDIYSTITGKRITGYSLNDSLRRPDASHSRWLILPCSNQALNNENVVFVSNYTSAVNKNFKKVLGRDYCCQNGDLVYLESSSGFSVISLKNISLVDLVCNRNSPPDYFNDNMMINDDDIIFKGYAFNSENVRINETVSFTYAALPAQIDDNYATNPGYTDILILNTDTLDTIASINGISASAVTGDYSAEPFLIQPSNEVYFGFMDDNRIIPSECFKLYSFTEMIQILLENE